MIAFRASSEALGADGEFKMIGDVSKPYPLIYMRFRGNEKFIVALNPSDKMVEAEIGTLNSELVKYVFGTSEKCSYKLGKTVDTIKIPALSAAIFKLE
jgi:maltose alpha-D-glucosyltransferase/alpha-amylase